MPIRNVSSGLSASYVRLSRAVVMNLSSSSDHASRDISLKSRVRSLHLACVCGRGVLGALAVGGGHIHTHTHVYKHSLPRAHRPV
eukprot:3935812-Rhodomonas_salina.2